MLQLHRNIGLFTLGLSALLSTVTACMEEEESVFEEEALLEDAALEDWSLGGGDEEALGVEAPGTPIPASLPGGSVACFDWNCDLASNTCNFDASCSVAGEGFIWKYQWTFGDGSTQLTGSPTTSHVYADKPGTSKPYPDYPVGLELLFFGSAAEPEVDCTAVFFSIIGPPEPNWGNCEGLYEIALTPSADTFIAQEQGSANFGSQNSLRVRSGASGAARYSFLQFQIPALGGIQSADLELRTKSNSIPSLDHYRVTNLSWSELGLTWNSWAASGSSHTLLGSQSNLAANTTHTIDMMGEVSGGTRTFGLASSTNQGGLDLYSREHALGPILRIRY